LKREVAARDAYGGEGRIRAARFPSRKSLEEFDFDYARGLERDLISHLGTLDFVAGNDEVGYIPFEPETANLFVQLVSSRYERASLLVTSNKPFGRWGEMFGDDVVAAAMIDRLVHHAEVVALKETPTDSRTEI